MHSEHGSVEDLLDVTRDDGRGPGAHRAPADAGPDPASPDDAPPDPLTPDPGPVATPLAEPEQIVGSTAGRLDRIEAALADTNRLLGAAAERAAARERVIDRQHDEIERLKAVERVGTMRPVVVDLCRLRNDLLRQARTLPPDTSVERFAGLLDSFAGSVAETLEACGVEALPLDPGAPFAAQQHRVASVAGTTDPLRDGVVAEVVADGYVETDGGKVVAPARVVLYRLEPGPDADHPPPGPLDPGAPTGIGSPHDGGVAADATTPVTTSEESPR